jgi:hypothetical protein
MRRFQCSIASVLGLVLFLAVACAALRQADELWDSAVFSLTVVVLVTSVLLAIHCSGRKRAFWLGFALFGWTYLIASLIPSVESRLLTSKGLGYLDSRIPGRESTVRVDSTWLSATQNTSGGYALLAANPQDAVRLWNLSTGRLLAGPSATSEDFVQIGHSLLVLILAFVGGRVSRWLRAREEQAGDQKEMDHGRR